MVKGVVVISGIFEWIWMAIQAMSVILIATCTYQWSTPDHRGGAILIFEYNQDHLFEEIRG
jgi:hypothetical protein